MKALVTGGAGFIGSNLVSQLLKLNYKVIIIDNLDTGSRKFFKKSELDRIKFIKSDLKNISSSEKYFKGIDLAIHLAALADIKNTFINTRKDFERNLLTTFNFLECVRLNKVSKIIFASSSAAIGQPKLIPTPEDISVDSQISLYGANKFASEALISAYCHGYGIKGVIFRFVSILGKNYHHGHVIDFYNQLVKNPNKLKVRGNGFQKKSYLHVNDCVEGIIKLGIKLTHKKNFEVYNLGHNDFCTVRQSIKIICNKLNLNPKIFYENKKIGWIGDNPFTFLDISKAKKKGWKPKYSIKKAIEDTVDYISQ